MREGLKRWSVPVALLAVIGTTGGPAQAALQCGKVVGFHEGKRAIRELHVRVNGNDSSGDGSAARPFATLGRAAKAATAGTAIRIHSGTYRGDVYIENLAGTAAAPIWIGGATGEPPPVFSGGTVGLLLAKVKYVVFYDFGIQWTSSHGINIHDNSELSNMNATRSVIFKRLNIHDTGGQCVKMAGVNDFQLMDSKMARCGSMNIAAVGVHNGVIAGNTLTDSEHGVVVKGGSYNIEIRWNDIRRSSNRALSLGGSTGYEYFRPPISKTSTNYEARDIRAIGNVIVDSKSPAAIVGCVSCYVANNTIINPKTFGFRILQESRTNSTYTFAAARGGRFFNNVIYYNRPSIAEMVNVGPYTAATTFEFKNNLWYAYNNPAQSQPTGLPVAEIGAIYGVNPGFLKLGDSTFSILTTSAAARSGVYLGSAAERYSTGDFDGKCWVNPPSVGAFEGR